MQVYWRVGSSDYPVILLYIMFQYLPELKSTAATKAEFPILQVCVYIKWSICSPTSVKQQRESNIWCASTEKQKNKERQRTRCHLQMISEIVMKRHFHCYPQFCKTDRSRIVIRSQSLSHQVYDFSFEPQQQGLSALHKWHLPISDIEPTIHWSRSLFSIYVYVNKGEHPKKTQKHMWCTCVWSRPM